MWRKYPLQRGGNMERYFSEIRAAVDGRLWTLAVMGVLAIPDICGALGSPDGRATGARFRNWVTSNLGERYPELDADEIYQMRCSMLHQGITATRSYTRTIFVVPDGRGNVMHNNIVDDAYQLDLVTFASDVINAAETWLATHSNDDAVRANLERTVRYYPTGLPPYIGGMGLVT
jgi:hypothetical protein